MEDKSKYQRSKSSNRADAGRSKTGTQCHTEKAKSKVEKVSKPWELGMNRAEYGTGFKKTILTSEISFRSNHLFRTSGSGIIKNLLTIILSLNLGNGLMR
jgi:hypothetical protein